MVNRYPTLRAVPIIHSNSGQTFERRRWKSDLDLETFFCICSIRALGRYTSSNFYYLLAEDEGFEPSIGFPIHAFQACALGRYANPPALRR
ncbi:MAG: hypothetical protein RL733_719, partial [Actinomycetota bacterium]